MTPNQNDKIHTEVAKQISVLMTSAFGLCAALAWNGTIQAFFKQIFGTTDTLTAQLTYAIIVTVIAVIVTRWIVSVTSKVNEKVDSDEEK